MLIIIISINIHEQMSFD